MAEMLTPPTCAPVRPHYEDIEQVEPSHPGFVIKTVLMPNFALSENDLAKRIGIAPDRLRGILSGSRPLTSSDARELSIHFGSVGECLLRIQVVYDFFKKNERRPTLQEKRRLFSTLSV
jgi:addiction module HigA family antidote